MGPWLADTIRQCDGLTDMMSYWTFSDVFEEQGVVKEPFYGGYGLMAEEICRSPPSTLSSCCTSWAISESTVDSKSALVTRRPDGTLVIAAWNLFLPEETGESKEVTIESEGHQGRIAARVISRLDRSAWIAARCLRCDGQARLSHYSRRSKSFARRRQLPPPETQRLESGQIEPSTCRLRACFDRSSVMARAFAVPSESVVGGEGSYSCGQGGLVGFESGAFHSHAALRDSS